MECINESDFFGRMNDPTASAFLKGPCGDEMEFYLVIENDTIVEVKYYTQGCEATRSCGLATAKLILRKKVDEALCISVGQIMQQLKDLPKNHKHCAILSVSCFYRAIADYLLQY